MMETLSHISKKYDKYYFKDKIKKGTKVVYIPDHGCFIYFYYDNGYMRDKFKPGDTMTVKLVKKLDPGRYGVYVYENEGVFGPKELLPAEVVDKEDIKKVMDFYREYKRKHKL